MAAPAICVVGSINLDMNAYVERFPRPGETLHGDRFTTGYGGKGANQAVAAAGLGGRVAMVGAVGTDANAAVALGRMSSVAVDRPHVQEVPGPTGLAIVAVDSRGENSIIVVPGEGVVLASDDTAGFSFPVTPICPPETVSDAVLRAAGGALGGSTTIAGWAGMIDDTPAGRAVYLLATSLPGSASVPGAIVLPPESVANALTDPALIELFQKQLPIVTRLAGSM